MWWASASSGDALRAAGQHLKRGVLLYGPPGTGKTHLVRHLLSQTEGTTAVLLSGRTLDLLNIATTLARPVQPAIVVLEDCDLVAEHRGGRTNAALFETLEAMDGLAADADITFILTTNRADLLERALVERPGPGGSRRRDQQAGSGGPGATVPAVRGRTARLGPAHRGGGAHRGRAYRGGHRLVHQGADPALRDQRRPAGPGADGRRRQSRAGRDALRRRGPDPDPARRRGPLLGRADRPGRHR